MKQEMRIERPSITPTWAPKVSRTGLPVKPLLAERPIRATIFVCQLSLTFSNRNPVYKTEVKEGRLTLEITENELRLLRRVGAEKSVFSSIAIDTTGTLRQADGRLLEIDGQPVNVNVERRLPAERIFPGLGEAPVALAARETEKEDFWLLPSFSPLEKSVLEVGEAKLSLALAADSVFLPAVRSGGLKIVKTVDMYTVNCDGYFLGGAKIQIERIRTIDLASEVPALNYGPTMAGLIEKKLPAILRAEAQAHRRALMPLVLFANEYLQRPLAETDHVLALLDQLTRAIQLLNDDRWFSPQQREQLAIGATLAALKAMEHPHFRVVLEKELRAKFLELREQLTPGQLAGVKFRLQQDRDDRKI